MIQSGQYFEVVVMNIGFVIIDVTLIQDASTMRDSS